MGKLENIWQWDQTIADASEFLNHTILFPFMQDKDVSC